MSVEAALLALADAAAKLEEDTPFAFTLQFNRHGVSIILNYGGKQIRRMVAWETVRLSRAPNTPLLDNLKLATIKLAHETGWKLK